MGETGSSSDGQGHAQFNLIFVGWSCVPFLLLGLRPNYGRGNLLQEGLCLHCCIHCPDPMAGHCQPMPPPETPGHSQASLAQSLMGSLILSPGSWCVQGFAFDLQESVSPVLWIFRNQIPVASKVRFPWGSQPLCRILRLRNQLRALELLQQCEYLFGILGILWYIWVVYSLALWWG